MNSGDHFWMLYERKCNMRKARNLYWNSDVLPRGGGEGGGAVVLHLFGINIKNACTQGVKNSEDSVRWIFVIKFSPQATHNFRAYRSRPSRGKKSNYRIHRGVVILGIINKRGFDFDSYIRLIESHLFNDFKVARLRANDFRSRPINKSSSMNLRGLKESKLNSYENRNFGKSRGGGG